MRSNARRLAVVVLGHWLAASVLLSLIAMGVDLFVLGAASGDHSPAELVRDGTLVAASLGVSAEWLLVAWVAQDRSLARRLTTAANALITFVLAVAYACVRMDILLADGQLLSPQAIGTVTTLAVVFTSVATLGSALVIGMARRGN